MGKFTDDMTKLVNDIESLTTVRKECIKNIQTEVKEWTDQTRKNLLNLKIDLINARSTWENKKTSHR